MRSALVCGALVLAACGSPPATPAPADRAGSVAAIVDAFDRHDVAALAAHFAPDTIGEGVGEHGWEAVRGRATLEADHRALFARQPDVKARTVRLIVAGDEVVQEWLVVGKDVRTGRKVGFAASTIYTFDANGLVARDTTRFDASVGRPLPDVAHAAAPIVLRADPVPSGDAAMLRRMYASRAALDVPATLAFFTDDVVVTSLYEPTDLVGKQALRAALTESAHALAALDVKVERLWSAGPLVAAEVTVRATLRDGSRATMHALDVAELRAGAIARVTSYGDSAELGRR